MSKIKERIDDADFLIANGKHESALALILIAIDGSAKKVFPEGYPSIDAEAENIAKLKGLDKPKALKTKPMKNQERYTRFLGVRLRSLLGMVLPDDAYFFHQIPNFYNGEQQLEELIYKSFRCEVIHEARLPEKYNYVLKKSDGSGDFSIEMNRGEVVFSKGLIGLLREVVVSAPTNGVEFGKRHLRICPNDGLTIDDILLELSSKYDFPSQRIDVFLRVIALADLDLLNKNKKEIKSEFDLGAREYLNAGAITGISLPDMSGRPMFYSRYTGITERGLLLLDELSSLVRVVDISS